MIARNLNKMLLLASLCLPGVVLAQNQNNVAKLTDAGGTVMVDRGKGFVSVKLNEPLYQDDRVVTLDGSMAEITYTDGCRTKLKSNNLIVISIDPGCKAAILDAAKAVGPVAAAGAASFIPPAIGAAIGIGFITWDDEPISRQ